MYVWRSIWKGMKCMWIKPENGKGIWRRMVAKGDMWDNIVMIKGRKYTMESKLTKRR